MTDDNLKKLVTVNGQNFILTSTFDCSDDSNNFSLHDPVEIKTLKLLKVDSSGTVTLLASITATGWPSNDPVIIGWFKWATDKSWKFKASDEGLRIGLPKEDEEFFSWSLIIIEKQWALKHIEVLFGDFQKLMRASGVSYQDLDDAG